MTRGIAVTFQVTTIVMESDVDLDDVAAVRAAAVELINDRELDDMLFEESDISDMENVNV